MTATLSGSAPTTTPTATEPFPRGERERRWRRMWWAMLLLLLVVGALYVMLGINNVLSPGDVWQALWHRDEAPRLHQLAVELRLPRLVLAITCGAALGASGALLQALTRNPLASPELTGVTAGAVAAALAWVAFGPSLVFVPTAWGRPFAAVVGGLATAIVVYLITRRSGSIESTRLLLIGILVGGVLSSFATLSLLFLGPDSQRILSWLSGSLALKTWTDALLVVGYLTPGLVLVVLAIPRANALQLGDDVARSLGQRREVDRLVVLTAAVILAAGVVAIVGAIGFIGLMAPHMVRRSVGSDLRRLVPASMMIGAVMLTVADAIARNLDAHWLFAWMGDDIRTSALPAGVILTLFGVPYLASLLWRQNR